MAWFYNYLTFIFLFLILVTVNIYSIIPSLPKSRLLVNDDHPND